MHQPIYKGRWVRRSAFLLLLLLIGYGTYRAVRPNPNMKKIRQLQSEFSSAQAKDWTPEQRREKFQEMRTAMQKLTPTQRDELSAEQMKREESRLKEYAQMSPVEKAKHLDAQIDRMEKMRQQFAGRNPNGGGQRPQGAPPGGFGTGSPGSGGTRPNLSPEEREKRRKERLDKTTPELRALRDLYRKDMEARRKQRGLKT
jgi:exonuclease VII large subunit